MSTGPDTSLGTTWPDPATFELLAQDRRVIPVVRRLLADGETPLGLYRKLSGDEPGTFLLESAEHGGNWSRYSIIGAKSAAILTSREGQTHWIGEPPVGVPTTGPVTAALEKTLAVLDTPKLPGLPPLTGGLVGALSYDLVRQWHGLDTETPDDLGLPEVYLALATDLVVMDHLDSTIWLIANAINHDNTDQRVTEAWQGAVQRLDRMEAQLQAPAKSTVTAFHSDYTAPVTRKTAAKDFEASVEIARQRMREGEASQVVLSQRFDVECAADPIDVYRTLRAANPSPYMYLLRCTDAQDRDFAVVGSSPEVLAKINDGHVVSRPIGGTRPRGEKPQDDLYLEQELRADLKELGEHDILVELAQDDMKKVCDPATVELTEYLTVERYSHVMHLVSTIAGTQRAGMSAYDVLKATFPAGTLSGAPKPEIFKIIDELEPQRRGIYGGTVGYFDFAGNMDMAIAIRTGVIREGVAHIQAGAGLVIDSVPETEQRECELKAAAMMRAVSTAATLTTPGDR